MLNKQLKNMKKKPKKTKKNILQILQRSSPELQNEHVWSRDRGVGVGDFYLFETTLRFSLKIAASKTRKRTLLLINTTVLSINIWKACYRIFKIWQNARQCQMNWFTRTVSTLPLYANTVQRPEQKAYSKIKYNSIIKYWLVTQVNKSSQLKQQAMAICYSMKEDRSFWHLFGQTEDVSAELWTGWVLCK